MGRRGCEKWYHLSSPHTPLPFIPLIPLIPFITLIPLMPPHTPEPAYTAPVFYQKGKETLGHRMWGKTRQSGVGVGMENGWERGPSLTLRRYK